MLFMADRKCTQKCAQKCAQKIPKFFEANYKKIYYIPGLNFFGIFLGTFLGMYQNVCSCMLQTTFWVR